MQRNSVLGVAKSGKDRRRECRVKRRGKDTEVKDGRKADCSKEVNFI